MSLSTHVLDAVAGRPATALRLRLTGDGVDTAAETDADGRCLLAGGNLPAGTYELTFETGQYYSRQRIASLYPKVTVAFLVEEPAAHLHVPLLLSPFAYSTYRGS